MIDRMAKRTGAKIAEQISSAIDTKMNPKTEWHAFTCELNHSFAVEMHTGIPTKKIIEFYGQLKCPLCYTEELNKESNL